MKKAKEVLNHKNFVVKILQLYVINRILKSFSFDGYQQLITK